MRSNNESWGDSSTDFHGFFDSCDRDYVLASKEKNWKFGIWASNAVGLGDSQRVERKPEATKWVMESDWLLN